MSTDTLPSTCRSHQYTEAFAYLRSADFNELMADEKLISVAYGVKQMMQELDITTASEVSAVFGHRIEEAPNMGALGITSTRDRTRPSLISIRPDMKPRVKEFVIYHELGHQALFSYPSSFMRPVSSRQEEVCCDAFACMMIGNKFPPRPLKPLSL